LREAGRGKVAEEELGMDSGQGKKVAEAGICERIVLLCFCG
jgi:hypothetical protein